MMVEHQLEMEKMKVESEKKKLAMAHEQIRDKVRNSCQDYNK